jgi:hypothetical protein
MLSALWRTTKARGNRHAARRNIMTTNQVNGAIARGEYSTKIVEPVPGRLVGTRLKRNELLSQYLAAGMGKTLRETIREIDARIAALEVR